MTVFYLDLEGGNDANDGTSFANRWKTFASGATAARIAPGDEIRVMASPTPTLLDSSTLWTRNSISVVMSGAKTAHIDQCESSWTAATNVTPSTTTANKEGTNAVSLAVAAAFTTGRIAHKTIASTDFSGYQQVSFWIKPSASVAAGVLEIRLCSDTGGTTAVDTLALPALPDSFRFYAITLNKGSALGSAIQSVALYAASDPGTITIVLDNIIACKAVGSDDSLTLNSLIGKVHNTPWVGSTSYAQNDKRIPTTPNRNGLVYKVQNVGGGTSSGSEPTWPAYIGGTVVDNNITWVCEDLEDTWYPIQSINGATIKIDTNTNADADTGKGYPLATETVSTYKFQPINIGAPSSSTTQVNAVQDSGTVSSPIRFTGGWDRTNMSTQTWQTFIDCISGNGYGFYTNGKDYVSIENFGVCRANYGAGLASSIGITLLNMHANACSTAGATHVLSSTGVEICGGNFSNNASGYTAGTSQDFSGKIRRSSFNSNGTSSSQGIDASSSGSFNLTGDTINLYNNFSYGISTPARSPSFKITGLRTRDNGSASIRTNNGPCILVKPSLEESTKVLYALTGRGAYVYMQDLNSTGAQYIVTDLSTIETATDQRNTASGYSWKFSPKETSRTVYYPLVLSLAKIGCKSGETVTVSVYTRRNSTGIKGILFLPGGQIAGVPVDVSVACEPSINTWVQSSNLTFTPTENGVVEIQFLVYDGVGTTNNYWIDDLAVSAS